MYRQGSVLVSLHSAPRDLLTRVFVTLAFRGRLQQVDTPVVEAEYTEANTDLSTPVSKYSSSLRF